MSTAGLAKKATKGLMRRAGFDVRRLPDDTARLRRDRLVFIDRAEPLIERHYAQTLDDVHALRARYAAPIFGPTRVFDLVERLALCIDSMDPNMGCVSQLTHAIQVVEGMTDDGIDDPDLLVAALIHDIGKLALLVGENPAYLCGRVRPIELSEEGAGLDQCIMQWSHDEIGYSRFMDHVPDHVAWLIRYHSVHVEDCLPQMNERDTQYARTYGDAFRRYDGKTKSMFREPRTRLADYRDLLDEAFPKPIAF